MDNLVPWFWDAPPSLPYHQRMNLEMGLQVVPEMSSKNEKNSHQIPPLPKTNPGSTPIPNESQHSAPVSRPSSMVRAPAPAPSLVTSPPNLIVIPNRAPNLQLPPSVVRAPKRAHSQISSIPASSGPVTAPSDTSLAGSSSSSSSSSAPRNIQIQPSTGPSAAPKRPRNEPGQAMTIEDLMKQLQAEVGTGSLNARPSIPPVSLKGRRSKVEPRVIPPLAAVKLPFPPSFRPLQVQVTRVTIILPIKSLPSWKSLTARVPIDAKVRDALLEQLTRIGSAGINYRESIGIVLTALNTPELWKHMDWGGLAGKEGFGNSSVHRVVCQAVHVHHPRATAAELELAVRNWLRDNTIQP